ncbi:hypothetical protein MTO96_042929 [Rhipicephalus appendiculatus]
MPGHCCVPGCRGNYDGEKAVRVFTFPADADRRRQWLKAIPRANFVPGTRSVVCEQHFRASDIRTSSSYVDSKTGKVVEAKLKIARLSPDAVPSVFPNCPAYLSAPATATSREAPDEKRMRLEAASLREAIAASVHSHEVEETRNKINDFQALLERVSEIQLSSFWSVISRPTCVVFLSLDSVDTPRIRLSIAVSQDLMVKVHCRHVQLTTIDGKFQTDCLEERFGKYRQLSGAQYHVSIRQVYESERKLRLQNILELPELETATAAVAVNDDVLDIFDIEVADDDYVKKAPNLHATTYVAGYCAHAAFKNLRAWLVKPI